jgi:predicted ATPase
VFAATGGNPFFVTELLAGPQGELPLTVRDAVLARASMLDAQARALLDLISVVPDEAELWLLEQAADSALDGLESCVAIGMLEEHGHAVRFRHELARLAIEQDVGAARKIELHRRVLPALEAGAGSPARLVHHAEAAGDHAALCGGPLWPASAPRRSAHTARRLSTTPGLS